MLSWRIWWSATIYGFPGDPLTEGPSPKPYVNLKEHMARTDVEIL